jgi:hypothetical protein
MAPPADIPSIRSPVSAEAPTPPLATTNVAQGSLSSLTQSAVGQVFQAQLLSQLEDGTFLVNIADSPLRMSLPAGSTVGETLDMTLLATEPRPAFLLDQQSSTTSALLSSAAKLINTALQTAQQSGAPATVVGKAPLVASPEVSTPVLADALKDSIEFSGVFYESHVSQWAAGERPLADLQLEPQVQAQEEPPSFTTSTQLNNPTASPRPAAGNSETSTGTLLPRPPATEEQLTNLMNAARSTVDARPSLAQALRTILSGNNLPKEADVVVREPTMTQQNAQNINLQLNTLEQHRIAWQGELWPGQRMEWEISEESGGGRQGGDADESQKVWQSVVRFDLPKLGKVAASISLSGGHVRMQVSTRSDDSAALLQAHGTELASALDAAGSPLDLLTIKQDGNL